MTRFYYLNRYRILHHRGVRKSIPTDGWVTWSLGRPPKSCRMNLIPVNTIQGSKVTQNMFSYCIGNQSFRGFVNGCFSILLHSPATWAFLWCPCRPRWAPDPEQKSRGQEQKEDVLPTERQTLEQTCYCWRAWADLGDVVVPPLPLLLLQLDGDSSDWTTLDTLHQVCHIATTDRRGTNLPQLFVHILLYQFSFTTSVP